MSAFHFLLSSVLVVVLLPVLPEELMKASISGCHPMRWPLIPPVPLSPPQQMSCPQRLQHALSLSWSSLVGRLSLSS
jgi:hypothetical protein